MSIIGERRELGVDGEDPPPLSIPSANYIDLTVRLGVLAALAYWSILLVRPFLTIVLWSIVLTVALFPIFRWLSSRLGGRLGLAAVFITALNLVIVLGPVTWLAVRLIETLKTLAERLVVGDL